MRRDALARAAEIERSTRVQQLESHQQQAARQNTELHSTINTLRTLLTSAMAAKTSFSFEDLKVKPTPMMFSAGGLAEREASPEHDAFMPPALKGAATLLPGAKRKHAEEVEAAEARFQAAVREHEQREVECQAKLAAAKAEFDAKVAEATDVTQQQHADVDELERRFEAGDPEAVCEYLSAALRRMSAPYEELREPRVAFSPQSRQLVIELELPTFDQMPTAREYRYVKARDEIAATVMPATERKRLYSSMIAQVALLSINTAFEADTHDAVETIIVNGHVQTVDKRTGQEIHPCLITVRTTRDRFSDINLERVDPAECLKGLNASVSRSPSDLVPVRPVVEFDMADPRFVKETDVLATLDTRPNLMELTPSEFESLITNLFEKMGLETRLTQPSRDGGVDCVAYDSRPILGGKVVIQAKRYKNTVGVSAVRDLYGTTQNEGASKGILVTTSGYGQASHEFANGKPLELIDGANLLYLLEEHAGIEAKIEVPEDWIDPEPET
jgi:restriction system protein